MSSDEITLTGDPPSALPRGTRLGEFELKRVLGVGGFGIVYLAFDHALEREVAIKEYMPASLAGRTETQHVSLRSRSDADTFALGLRSFVNEAKLLARFDHPSLLKVHRFWEANGTAYMAMPVLRGRNLKDVRARMTAPPTEAWVRDLLMPLLGAIEKLHSEGVYHRDIAPDNIHIEANGHPVLLDFGAARRVLTDKSQNLTAILKPAYAPIEQYGEAGAVKQGPWTDLYALGATVHFMLLGRPPMTATARTLNEDVAPMSRQSVPSCSGDFLTAVDWMLSPRPSDRPQSVAELRDVLEGRTKPPKPAAGPVINPAPASSAAEWPSTQIMASTAVQPTRSDDGGDPDATVVTPWPASGGSTVVPPARTVDHSRDDATMVRPRSTGFSVVPPAATGSPPPPVPAPPSPRPTANPPAPRATVPAAAKEFKPARQSPPWLWIVGGVVVVAAAAGAFFLSSSSRPSVAPVPTPAASAASSVTPVASGPSAGPAITTPAPAPAASSAPAPAAEVQAPIASTPAVAAPPAPPVVRPQPGTEGSSKPAARPQAPTTKPAPLPPVKNGDANRPVGNSGNAQPPTTSPYAEQPAQRPAGDAARPSRPPPVVQEAVPAAHVGSPTENCGRRVLVALWLCIERECAKPELKQHPECVKWRADQEQRNNPNR